MVHPGAGAYICGEETALLESLEGKRGYPRIKPPFFPAAIGLYGAPTIVNNVETRLQPALGHAERRRATSPPSGRAVPRAPSSSPCPATSSGRATTSWSGPRPPSGTSSTTPRLGGGIRDDNELKAFIPGGASSPWLGPEHLDVLLANEAIAAVGSMAGSGSVIAMDHTTCTVRAAWRIVRFFHRESCGQCTPCREGGGWLEKILERIEDGQGREADLDLLMDVCDNISPGVTWPPGADDHLRARPVDAARRWPPASACSGTSTWPTSARAAARSPRTVCRGGWPVSDTAREQAPCRGRYRSAWCRAPP